MELLLRVLLEIIHIILDDSSKVLHHQNESQLSICIALVRLPSSFEELDHLQVQDHSFIVHMAPSSRQLMGMDSPRTMDILYSISSRPGQQPSELSRDISMMRTITRRERLTISRVQRRVLYIPMILSIISRVPSQIHSQDRHSSQPIRMTTMGISLIKRSETEQQYTIPTMSSRNLSKNVSSSCLEIRVKISSRRMPTIPTTISYPKLIHEDMRLSIPTISMIASPKRPIHNERIVPIHITKIIR